MDAAPHFAVRHRSFAQGRPGGSAGRSGATPERSDKECRGAQRAAGAPQRGVGGANLIGKTKVPAPQSVSPTLIKGSTMEPATM